MLYPTKKEFIKLAKKGNLIPVYGEMLADFETPLSVFAKIDKGDHSFLLESVEGGERLARYSFLGSRPSMIFSSKGRDVEIKDRGQVKRLVTSDPISELRKIIKRYKVVSIKGLPRFCGGLVGYIGYDMVRFFEDIPDKNSDEIGAPDAVFMLTENILVFDHVDHKIKVVSNVHVTGDPAARYDEATKKIESIIKDLKSNTPMAASRARKRHNPDPKVYSNFTKKDFENVVTKTKEYIRK
ncbi:MAG TPA: anthranilate synthase component I, partial [Candidatus Omnitrophota bacterium]|nr:anthranilate synthase component I [Candidatus Omnitrophota bacterium]